MDTTCISKKMLNSDEYKQSQEELDTELKSLENQLLRVKKLIEKQEDLQKLGYKQYQSYFNNGRKDKITDIPMIGVYSWDIQNVIHSINNHFKWQKEFKGRNK